MLSKALSAFLQQKMMPSWLKNTWRSLTNWSVVINTCKEPWMRPYKTCYKTSTSGHLTKPPNWRNRLAFLFAANLCLSRPSRCYWRIIWLSTVTRWISPRPSCVPSWKDKALDNSVDSWLLKKCLRVSSNSSHSASETRIALYVILKQKRWRNVLMIISKKNFRKSNLLLDVSHQMENDAPDYI